MSWESHKQNITATSSAEAGYTAQCAAVKEAIYLRQFLNELPRAIIQPTVINADNTGVMALANDLVQHKRSRHVDFQYHYAREKVADNSVIFNYMPTEQMIVDGFIKALPRSIGNDKQLIYKHFHKPHLIWINQSRSKISFRGSWFLALGLGTRAPTAHHIQMA